MINIQKLDYELKTAGIPVEGCNSNGEIWFLPEATDEQKELAKKILANHNPKWWLEQRREEYAEIGNWDMIPDEIDYIYKIFLHLRNKGIDLGAEGNEWVDKINVIKKKYPKE